MKYKVIQVRLMSGYRKGQIVNFPNKDYGKVFDDGFGGIYERYEE